MSAAARILRGHRTRIAPLVSPAVGEHALTVTVPRLEQINERLTSTLADALDALAQALREVEQERAAHNQTRLLLDVERGNTHALIASSVIADPGW